MSKLIFALTREPPTFLLASLPLLTRECGQVWLTLCGDSRYLASPNMLLREFWKSVDRHRTELTKVVLLRYHVSATCHTDQTAIA